MATTDKTAGNSAKIKKARIVAKIGSI